MKKIKILMYISGAIAYFVFATLLTGWDNRDMHKYLNEYMVDEFKSSYTEYDNLSNYEFEFDKKLEGKGVTEGGLFSVSEGDMNLSIKDWVIHGGYSCDEPNSYQALRHFYDPVGIDDGKHYLTDFANIQYLGTAMIGGNPGIDAVEWALEYNGDISRGTDQIEQNYSFKDAKDYLIEAFEAKSEDVANRKMAAAWRALGEVLHLYADMGLPCHVRNDGHPPYLGGGTVDWWLHLWGDPSPVEDMIRTKAQTHGSAASTKVSDIKGKATPQQMFETMAEFTNNNFFSDETIYGKLHDGTVCKPYVRKNNPYLKPALAGSGGGWDYDEDTFTYTYVVDGHTVKMCRDCYYFDKNKRWRGKWPTIDRECAESQAKILLPTVINSGPAIIAKLLPKMEVSYTTVIENINRELYGEVKHKVNDEYPEEIGYNGYVEVYINGKKKYTVVCDDGDWEVDDPVLNEGDEVEVRAVIGGLIINSSVPDYEMRIINTSGELSPDPNDIDLLIPTSAKMGEAMHIEGKWGQDLSIYPDATYSISAGWVNDTTKLWQTGQYDEELFKEVSHHHYFRLDVDVPESQDKKFLKLQISMKAAMADGRYWLQGRIYKIPVK